ncbi:hypothetical protein ACH5RR_006010, partial [Cinchona calisaya]
MAPGGLAGDRRAVVPASGFSFSGQQIWKIIKENKDLDLPDHKVMVTTVFCKEIVKEKCGSFLENEGNCWKNNFDLFTVYPDQQRDKLWLDIYAHVAKVCTAKLSELTTTYETKLNEALSGSAEALLDGATDATWPGIRKLLQCKLKEQFLAFLLHFLSLKLSVMEAIRLDDEVDNIEKTLSVALLDGKCGASTSSTNKNSDNSCLVNLYGDSLGHGGSLGHCCSDLPPYIISMAAGFVQHFLDDIAFENQSALFALAVSDKVLIN